MSLVSIIVPIYQSEEYIDRCVRSILNQNYSKLEVILINDGSTDKSWDKCQYYAHKYDNIQAYSQQNRGASFSRNRGIKLSHGKYAFFMDADDEMVDNCISKAVNAMELGNEFVFFDYYIGAKNDNKYYVKNNVVESLDKDSAISKMLNVQTSGDSINGYLWNKFFDLSIIKQNDIEFDNNAEMWEDLLFCIQYLKCVNSIVHINERLYIYKESNEKSVSRALSAEAALTWIGAGEKIRKIISENFNEQYDVFCAQLINVYMTYVIVSIKQKKKIENYKNIIDLLENNREKLRKKYKAILDLLKISPKVAYFFIKAM